MLRHLLLFLTFLWTEGACPIENTTRVSDNGNGVITVSQAEYAETVDCRWTITNKMTCPNKGNPIITIVWDFVDTDHVQDQIIIYDGASTEARILQQVSGRGSGERPLNSSTSSLFVVFTTDGLSNGEMGFSFQYRFVCGPPKINEGQCQPPSNPKVLTVRNSAVQTINFTDASGGYQECFWVIKNELPDCDDPYVEVQFTNFSALVPYDFVELYEGSHKDTSNMIGRYQGPKVYHGPGIQRSEGQEMLIVFHNEYAHEEGEWTGFSARVTAGCNLKPGANCPLRKEPRVFDKAGYMVFSHTHYRAADSCFWLFKNTNTTCRDPVVLMIFPVFRTTELYDTVTLYDGETTENQIGRWSGEDYDAVPLGFQRSTRSSVLLEFHSGALPSGSDFNRGFTVQFAFPCGEELPKSNEVTCPSYISVESPPTIDVSVPQILNFTASSYRNNLDCGWFYVNNQQRLCEGGQPVLQLEFLHFETEPNFDYLNIYDSPLQRRSGSVTYDEYYLMGSYSGSRAWELPPVTRSTTDSIMVTFHSDGTVSDLGDGNSHNDGFQIRVTPVCDFDPLPTTSNYDCRGDVGMTYARFWTSTTLQNPRVRYGHRYLPFSVAFPVIIEQFFTNPNPRSLLESRGARGVMGPVVIGYNKGINSTNWTCCGELAPTQLRGAIVACQRGDCLFVEKVRIAQSYGAVGVIIVDTFETGVRMGSTVDVSDLIIPSVSTVASLGNLIVNTSARGQLFASLNSYVCPDGTYSPTQRVTYTPNPTPVPFVVTTPTIPPTSLRAPTPPTSPTTPSPNMTMYFTLAVESLQFTEDARARFLTNVSDFFGWPLGIATLRKYAADPDVPHTIVAEVVVDEPHATSAFQQWGVATPSKKLTVYPTVLDVSRHQPHSHCIAVDCESTSLRTAQWDTFKCTCSRYITGTGVFVYIILPILLVLVLIFLACRCCPFSPFYRRYQRPDHRKVATSEMQGRRIMPHGVKDSEESVRGEGQPEDTMDDPPAETHDWDEPERRPPSAPIRLGGPKSDDSDDEGQGLAR